MLSMCWATVLRAVVRRYSGAFWLAADLLGMELHQFESLIDELGEDFAKWPEPAAREAQALLETSPQARAIWQEAAQLRQLLSKPVRAPAGLLERIVKAVEAETPERSDESPEPVSGRSSD